MVDKDGNEVEPGAEGDRLMSVGQNEKLGNNIEILSSTLVNQINKYGWNYGYGILKKTGEVVVTHTEFECSNYIPLNENNYVHVINSDTAYIWLYDNNLNPIERIDFIEEGLSIPKEVLNIKITNNNAQYISINTKSKFKTEVYISSEELMDFTLKSNKKEIPLNEPLRKLSDEVKDRIIKRDGKWYIERNCGEKRVLDTWDWVKSTATEDYYWCKDSDFMFDGNQINVLCNKLKSATTVESNDKNFYTDNYDYVALGQHMYFGAIAIDLNPNTLVNKSIAGFKEYLRNNEVNIIYPLKTPVYEEIADVKLITYLNITHISNNSNIPTNMKVTVDRVMNRATEAIELMKINPTIANIEKARMWSNLLKESTQKDNLHNQINNITNIENLEIEKKTMSVDIDLYIKSLNSLTMSLSTSSIIFDEFSGIQDMEKLNAVEITIGSSLPYQLNSYMMTELKNNDNTNVIPKELLSIRLNGEAEYKSFSGINKKLVLKENYDGSDDNMFGIDLILKGDLAHKADVYKTILKFEAEQK